MAKFRVWAKMIEYAYLDVEAPDKEIALEIAEETDGSYFHGSATDVDWEFVKDDIERLDSSAEVDFAYDDFE